MVGIAKVWAVGGGRVNGRTVFGRREVVPATLRRLGNAQGRP